MIKIYKEHKDAKIPTRANKSDAGLDIYSIADTTINPGKRKVVEIGLRIIVPFGYYYTFAARSGLAFYDDLVPSHHNVMDAGYSGPCGVMMLNRNVLPYKIKKGDRFCQVIIHKVPTLDIDQIYEKEFLSIKTERSEGRLGSSGK